jgi:hypothetical protein
MPHKGRRRKYKPRQEGKHFCYVLYQNMSRYWRGNEETQKRNFPSYEHAVMHLTNIKLGIDQEVYPYIHYKPVKIIAGRRIHGNKVVTMCKALANTEAVDERNSVGRSLTSSGQYVQQRDGSVPSAKVMDVYAKAIPDKQWPSYDLPSRCHRPAQSNRPVERVDGLRHDPLAVSKRMGEWHRSPVSHNLPTKGAAAIQRVSRAPTTRLQQGRRR